MPHQTFARPHVENHRYKVTHFSFQSKICSFGFSAKTSDTIDDVGLRNLKINMIIIFKIRIKTATKTIGQCIKLSCGSI